MMIQVRLFARARDLVRTGTISIELSDRGTVNDLRMRIASAYPALQDILPRSAVAVNEEYAEDSTVIPKDAEVALLPPVSGG